MTTENIASCRGGVTRSQFFSQLATRSAEIINMSAAIPVTITSKMADAQRRRELAIALLLLAELDSEEELEYNGKERSVWVRPWIARREERGCFHQVSRCAADNYD